VYSLDQRGIFHEHQIPVPASSFPGINQPDQPKVNATTLSARVSRTIRELKLFNPGDTVIVAISGGADSTALLDLLSKLPEFSPRLVAAHLNHCLRGTESDADEEFVRSLATLYGIPIESRRIDVRDMSTKQGLNLEDAGRRARISFLDEIRTRWQANAIALAHHADDQAETVLMRLLRGSGMAGLSGMAYHNEHGRIRPLLNISRAEIEDYLKARGLSYREDASNLDTTFLRNRIRHELLPLLQHYNPAIRGCLTTTAELLSDENKLLKQLTEGIAERVCRLDGGIAVCNISILREEPLPLRRRFFRLVLEKLAGSLDHFSHRHIMALEHLIDSPRPNATLNLPQGVTALREYDTLMFRLSQDVPVAITCEFVIEKLGRYEFPDGASLTLKLAPGPANFSEPAPNTAFFDLDKAPFPWHVRTFRSGDRIVPLGMSGSKKVKELFIDNKIPFHRRRQNPLVFSGDTLIWVCGLRTSQLAKVDGASSRIISAVFTGKQEPF